MRFHTGCPLKYETKAYTPSAFKLLLVNPARLNCAQNRAEHAAAPAAEVYPLAHTAHVALAAAGWYFPGRQGEQPPVEVFRPAPGAHTHALEPTLPAGAVMKAGQGAQAALPAAVPYMPTGQA